MARASSVSGPAVLISPGLNPLALTAGYILNPGDRIDTRGGGRVVIDLSDGSMVVVAPESVVVLKDYRAASSLRELFEITIGIVRVKINHFAGKPNPYRMNSPTASIAVRGTEFSIDVDDQGTTQVTVFEGAVEVSSLTDPSRRVLIEAGRGVLVQAGQDFHLMAAASGPPPPGRDPGDRNAAAQPDRGKPPAPPAAANAHAQEDRGDGPQQPAPAPGSPPAPKGQPQQGPQVAGGNSSHDHEENSPRATAGTYDRYLASLVDIGQLPFLFRFNAFPEAHLDSLENPAYATGFHTAEGRIFVLPTFRGARTLQEYQSAFGPSGSLPSDYSVSPQVSFFAPAGKFTFGGSASLSRVGNTSVTSTLDSSPGEVEHETEGTSTTTGDSSTTYYSGALVAARSFGANSVGLELSALKGAGSFSSITRQPQERPGHLAEEVIRSASDITQTRVTAGYSRDLSRTTTIGVFYRYAFIHAHDRDVSHTINNFSAGLNGTRTGGHSSETGMRLRGLLTPRLYYGFTAAWLGISLLDGMTRTTTVDSHERDRAQRGSVAIGLGYALTRRTTLSFDLAGGSARTWASRTEDSTRKLLQNAVADSHFASAHAAVQSDITRRLFLTASLLQVWQNHGLNVDLFPDRFGNRTSVEDSFFSMNPASSRYASRFSDFGAGWRFTHDLFAQYVFSTDYGTSSATHTIMLRYTFHPGGR